MLSSPDSVTDAELEAIAQRAIDETFLDIEESEIELIDIGTDDSEENH